MDSKCHSLRNVAVFISEDFLSSAVLLSFRGRKDHLELFDQSKERLLSIVINPRDSWTEATFVEINK